MTSPIIVALDYQQQKQAFQFLDECDPKLCRVKVGKGMFTRFGPDFVKSIINRGYDVFLDLKFHDIPNTVYDACRAAVDLGVWMLNVHACGGADMLAKAKQAVADDALLIAVTVLTSLQDEDLYRIGSMITIEELVLRLAELAKQHGLDGVVASGQEAQSIKSALGSSFKVVTPGIRLAADSLDDQKRVMTPEEAFKAGADYLVIGRSITNASNPKATLKLL